VDITSAPAAVTPPHTAVVRQSTHWLAWIWLVGAVLAFVPLAIGLMANIRMRIGNRRLDDSDWQRLVTRLNKQLGLRRPVTLLRAGPRQMPLTFGLWHPCVVLPADAQSWTRERREIVLLHELAHIQRYDVPMQIIARFCCALYWFHPLAWWALRRMRVEREHACDDSVLLAGQKASGYASELLEIARAHSGCSPILNAALSMARPSQLEGRLLAVLDANRCRTPVGMRWTGGLLALTAGLVFALGVVRPTARANGPSPVENVASIAAPQSSGRHNEENTITGIVLAPDGKPVPGATVEVIAADRNDGWHHRLPPGDPGIEHYQTKTDDTGHFRLNVPRNISRPRQFMSVLASDQNHHLATADIGPRFSHKDLELNLKESKTVRLQIIDAAGNPVAGVEPQLEYVSWGPGSYLSSVFHPLWKSLAAAWPRFTPSDDRGYVSILVPVSSKILSLTVDNERTGAQTLRVDVSKEPMSVALKPARYLNGRVIDAQNGHPVAGAEVVLMEQPYRRVRTNADGTFRALSGTTIRTLFPNGESIIHVYPPPDSPNLFQAIEWEWPNKGIGDAQLLVRLEQGLMVEGQVVEKGSGRPVAGASLAFDPQQTGNRYFRESSRSRLAGADMRYATGADGRFRMPVLPGPGWLLVTAPTLDYVHQQLSLGEKHYGKEGLEREYYDGVVKLNLKPGEHPAPLAVELERGGTLRRKVVLPDGKPVDGSAYARSYLLFNNNINQSLPEIPIEEGLLALPGFEPKHTNPVYLVDRKCEYGATVWLSNAELTSPPIVLERCGKVRMRIVNDKGKPLANYLPFVFIVVTPGAPATHFIEPNQLLWLDSMNWWGNRAGRETKTDADGRVTIDGMIPGATYRVSYPGGNHWTSGHEFKIRAGETTDIGDIVLPKRG